jgi:hypothetical protein
MKVACGIARSIGKGSLAGSAKNKLSEKSYGTGNILDIIRKGNGKARSSPSLGTSRRKHIFARGSIETCAAKQECSLTDVYGVATFYKAFT